MLSCICFHNTQDLLAYASVLVWTLRVAVVPSRKPFLNRRETCCDDEGYTVSMLLRTNGPLCSIVIVVAVSLLLFLLSSFLSTSSPAYCGTACHSYRTARRLLLILADGTLCRSFAIRSSAFFICADAFHRFSRSTAPISPNPARTTTTITTLLCEP